MALFKAICDDELDKVRSLIQATPSLLDSYDSQNFGATPLTAACFSNKHAMVELLLELGADPNRKSQWNMGPWSPLHCAIHRRDSQLAQKLLKHGAVLDAHTAAGLGWTKDLQKLLDEDPERVRESGGDGCQPLHFAETCEVADLLINRGADVEARCLDHYSTPVQYLCGARPEVAKHLFLRGARSDIFSAAMCGATDVIQNLLAQDAKCAEARMNQQFFPPGNGHDVHNIMTFTVGHNATPLHAAATANQPEAIELLATRLETLDVRGGYDEATPLHLAAWNDRLEAAKKLVALGADINLRSGDLHRNTPAGWAIVAGSERVFHFLLDSGAETMPWFIEDAKAALAGAFKPIKTVPEENYRSIHRRLT